MRKVIHRDGYRLLMGIDTIEGQNVINIMEILDGRFFRLGGVSVENGDVMLKHFPSLSDLEIFATALLEFVKEKRDDPVLRREGLL